MEISISPSAPEINEHLSEEVIPHKTRDNTTAPVFQTVAVKEQPYHRKRFALCLRPRLYSFYTIWNSFFSTSESFLTAQSTSLSVSSCGTVFKHELLCPKISRVSKLYCLPSTQKEVHWNSVHVAASQQCFISSRNTCCFSSSRFQKETFGGFSIQSVNRH